MELYEAHRCNDCGKLIVYPEEWWCNECMKRWTRWTEKEEQEGEKRETVKEEE
jgi:uncharacterized OB-fold protein